MYLDKNALKRTLINNDRCKFVLNHIYIANETNFREVADDIPLVTYICMDGTPYDDITKEIFDKYPYSKMKLNQRISDNWAIAEPPCLISASEDRKIIGMMIDVEKREEDEFSTLREDVTNCLKLLVDWTKTINEDVFFIHKLNVDWWTEMIEEIDVYIHEHWIETGIGVVIVIAE